MATVLSENCRLRNFTAGDMDTLGSGGSSRCAEIERLDPSTVWVQSGQPDATVYLVGKNFDDNTQVVLGEDVINNTWLISSTLMGMSVPDAVLGFTGNLPITTQCEGVPGDELPTVYLEVVPEPAWPAPGCPVVGSYIIGPWGSGSVNMGEAGFSVHAVDKNGVRNPDLLNPSQSVWPAGTVVEIRGTVAPNDGMTRLRIPPSPSQNPRTVLSTPPGGLEFIGDGINMQWIGTVPSWGDPVEFAVCPPVPL